MKEKVTIITVRCDICNNTINREKSPCEYGVITLYCEGKDMFGNGAGHTIYNNADLCQDCLNSIRVALDSRKKDTTKQPTPNPNYHVSLGLSSNED